jgi:head-tail adaptor
MPLPYPYQKIRDPLSIPPGLLRFQVQVQQPASTQDSLGSSSPGFVTVLTTMASVEDVNGREGYERTSLEYSSQITHRVRFRYPGSNIGLGGGYRVLFGSRIFTVQYVVNVQQRNRVIILNCVEVDATL